MDPEFKANLQYVLKHKLTDWAETDRNHYEAAETWLAAGKWEEAVGELTRIDKSHWEHPVVLCCKSRAWALAQQWDLCAHVASQLCRVAPHFPDAWIRAAFALHKSNRTDHAKKLLTAIAPNFPDTPDMWWYIALYSFELGDFPAAHAAAKEAIQRTGLQPDKALARAPELQPLCQWLDQTKFSHN